MQGAERGGSSIKEEPVELLSEMEQGESELRLGQAQRQAVRTGWRLCLEISGAILLGVLCGILSHAAAILLVRTLS